VNGAPVAVERLERDIEDAAALANEGASLGRGLDANGSVVDEPIRELVQL
jgi:hypothetical protein